jgi:hypothetical protein
MPLLRLQIYVSDLYRQKLTLILFIYFLVFSQLLNKFRLLAFKYFDTFSEQKFSKLLHFS